MDSFYLGDALRSLDLIPTLSLIEKLGGTTKKCQKYITIEEFLPIIHDVTQMKDLGSYEIFVECLRLHDHYETGSINLGDLKNILLNYGERLTEDEVNAILEECCDPESPAGDDDGYVFYESKWTFEG